MSRRNEHDPKKPCPVCGALIRRVGKHVNQKHPVAAGLVADARFQQEMAREGMAAAPELTD